jgi:hypothetical protein
VQLGDLALVAGLVLAGVAVALVLRRRGPSGSEKAPGPMPILRLRTLRDDLHVVPETIEFPRASRLRIGYHPPLMDRHVGNPEFLALPHVDIRGNASAVRELSRHTACIWRDAVSGECYVQLGWPGPGEPIRPRGQTRLLRLGRAHDAASQPFRLAHLDVLRLAAGIEYVFLEVDALRDRTTPEERKIEALERTASGSRIVSIRGGGPGHDAPR